MTLCCPACNYENEGTALFCHSCGRPLAEGEAAGHLLGTQILGTYQLTDLLGQGGMSVVYRARHVLTDQEVAVKLLPPELSNQRELKARFIEEARTLARLEHPNIVTLHNLVESEGYLYLVMQFAEGETFDNIIAREGRVEMGEAVRVAIEVLRALEYAHDQGVIHRDIKPSNVIIRGDGTVKVMDFGIAKIMGSTKLTQTGQTMGTVRYMSPEQVRGKQVDHRSDLYSLGITLYEGLTGRTPFDGENHFEIMQKHLSDQPPSPSTLVPMPDQLEEVLLQSIRKNAEQRFQTAREFRRALQRVPVEWDARRRSQSMKVPDFSADIERDRRRRRRRPIKIYPITIAVVLLALSGVAFFWALRDNGEPVHAAGTGATPTKAPVARVPLRAPWPKPHWVAASLQWKTQKLYGPPVQLQIFSMKELEPDPLRDVYVNARQAYIRFLREEGMNLEVRVGPLNLCFVDQEVLNSKAYWPDVKPNMTYPTRYQAPSATLYVSDSEASRNTDLPYGLALHFCARVAQLSNRRCLELAESFEIFLRKQK